MPELREAVPADTERAVRIEAGFRCAIPTCRHPEIEVAHIVPYAESRDNRFENLIALCPNHHTQYDKGNRGIDRKAIRQIKANMAEVNGRYGEFERRVLDHFVRQCDIRDCKRQAWGEPSTERFYEEFLSIALEYDPDLADEQRVEIRRGAQRAYDEAQNPPFIDVPVGMELLVEYLIRDGYLAFVPPYFRGITLLDGVPTMSRFQLTTSGEEFVAAWTSAASIAWRMTELARK